MGNNCSSSSKLLVPRQGFVLGYGLSYLKANIRESAVCSTGMKGSRRNEIWATAEGLQRWTGIKPGVDHNRGFTPASEKQREITQRSPLTSHQAKESLPTRYEITADGCSASTDKRGAKKAFKHFLFFQFAGAVCSCVNLFTIPLRNRFLIRLLASLNPGYHYGRAN